MIGGKSLKRFMIMAVVLLLTAMVRNAAIAEETLHPVIMISEVMASNDSIATYPKADYTDWVEILWQFPDGATIRPGEYRVILCDKEPEKSTDTELHASFTISRKSGEVIILTDAEGAVHDRITLPEMKTDTSFGRNPEDGGLYCYDPPTPFAANGNGFGGYAAAPSFSEEPGFYDSARHLRIIIPEDTQVFYTLDGSEPTRESTPYGGETLEITETTVIRARAFAEGMIRPGDTLTGTFFIHVDHSLPVISVTVDPDDLWNRKHGMLTVGKKKKKKEGLPFRNTVYRKVKNSGVKYASYVEMYDDAGKRIVSQGADISLNGDYSLDMPQKSFKFKAKSKYGEKTFKAKLFPDRDYEEYKSFVLRNSGNDCMWTRLQDGFQSRLMELFGSTVAHQAWKPYVVYLNGQYWGHMNLRERVDEYMVAQFEGLDLKDADRLDLLEANGRAKNGSGTDYKAMIKKIKAGKPDKKQEDLQYILDNVDVDNYFGFMAFEMFFGNSDIGNFRIYRLNAPGSKWKWLINDLDYGLWQEERHGSAELRQYDLSEAADRSGIQGPVPDHIRRNLSKTDNGHDDGSAGRTGGADRTGDGAALDPLGTGKRQRHHFRSAEDGGRRLQILAEAGGTPPERDPETADTAVGFYEKSLRPERCGNGEILRSETADAA